MTARQCAAANPTAAGAGVVAEQVNLAGAEWSMSSFNSAVDGLVDGNGLVGHTNDLLQQHGFDQFDTALQPASLVAYWSGQTTLPVQQFDMRLFDTGSNMIVDPCEWTTQADTSGHWVDTYPIRLLDHQQEFVSSTGIVCSPRL